MQCPTDMCYDYQVKIDLDKIDGILPVFVTCITRSKKQQEKEKFGERCIPYGRYSSSPYQDAGSRTIMDK